MRKKMKVSTYRDTWERVDRDCMLCRMEKKTEWYVETPHVVIAEKLSGGPFVVWKEHTKSLTEEQMSRVEHTVGVFFDEFELDVIMSHCPNHWHAHIQQTGDGIDLSEE
jgi:hypothetical protein